MTKLPILTQPQQKVYLATLELNTDSVQNISKKAQLPRSTAYLIIDELIKLGLLSQTKKARKTLISAESPEKLIQLIKNRQASLNQSLKQLKQTLPQLQAIHNKRQDKPIVSFYQGFEGLKTVLEKTLKAQEILVICSGGQNPITKELNNYLFNTYFPATKKTNLKTREIIAKDHDYNRYIKDFADKNHLIKPNPCPITKHHLDKLIFSNTVAIIDYDSLNATLIIHPYIAELERTLFNQLWQTL